MSSATVTTVPPPTYTATTIPNNTYYLGAQSFGVAIGFASASGNLTSFNFTSGDTSQQWQITGSPVSPGHSAAYTFKNVRYNTYISCVAPSSGTYYLSQSKTPSCAFFARGCNGGYLFSPDPDFPYYWDVPEAIDLVTLEPLESATVVILATLNQSSSLSSSLIGSSSTTSISSSGRTGPSFTSSSPSTGTTTINAASQTGGGLAEGNKISLGVGIGIGIPSFLIAVLSAWLVFLSRKRKRQNKSARKSEKARAAEEMATVNNGNMESVSVEESELQEPQIRDDHLTNANQKIEGMPRPGPGMTGEGIV